MSIDVGMEIEVKSIGQLILKDHIRTGGSADVYVAEAEDGEQYAVKIHRARKNSKQHELDISRESTKFVNHPNICSCLDSGIVELSNDRKCHALVFPLFLYDELGDYMEEDFTGTRKIDLLSKENKLSISRDIIAGIAAIHKAGWIHGDISSRNVLLNSESNQVKVIDFEFARPLNETPGNEELNRGTKEYTAPEVDHYNIKATSGASDIWALGILLAEIWNSNIQNYLRDIGGWVQWKEMHGTSTPIITADKPSGIPEQLWELVRNCSIIDRSLRPTSEELSIAFNEYRGE